MAGVTNVKTVRFKSENQMGYGDDLYAHDVGQILRFTGITLPGLYRVYFSRFPEGEGVIRLGDENGVTVPSECLTYPGPLYVWIVLTHAEKDKTTTYKALLQVLARSDVPDVPDEESGSVITDAINAMNDVMGRVERAEDVLNRAETVVSGIESYPSVTYYECSQLRKVTTVVPVADIDNPLYPSPGLSSQYADGVGLVIPLQSGYTPKENDLFMIKATDDILLPERTNNRKYSALYISFLIVEHTDDGGIQQHEEPRLIYNIPYNYPAGTRMFDKGRVYIFRYRPHTASDPYQQDTSYGTGFDVLNYMVGVKEAVETAKEVMDEAVSLVTEKAVRYDERQTLTEEQQVMARSNIRAAMLDANGRVPASQLPSYVDDVLEGYADPQQDPITTFYRIRMGEVGNYSYSEPYTPEAGKIYVDMETVKTYRWSGSGYVMISQSLALGETSSTAFPGDRGKKTEDDLNAMVKVQENQPVEDANKIWIDETGDNEVTVPTIQEFHSLIKVQNQQPTEVDNRLWIDEEAADEVQVVTVDDFNALERTVVSNVNRITSVESQKISKPETNPNGISGQILRSNGDGTVVWDNAIAVDNSLSITGAAADAKKTGDEIGELKSTISDVHALAVEIDGKAPIITVQETGKVTNLSNIARADDSGLSSVSVTGLGLNRLIAFNGENLLGDITKWRSDTKGGFTSLQYYRDHIRVNGTNTGIVRFYYSKTANNSYLELDKPIPAGTMVHIAGFCLGTATGSSNYAKMNIYFDKANKSNITDKQVWLYNNDAFHVSFTLNQDAYYVRVYLDRLDGSTWTAEDVDIYPLLFTGSDYIKKSYTSIPAGSEYALNAETISGWDMLTTTPYEHKVIYDADTKSYVDNHVPDDYVVHDEIVDFIKFSNLKYYSPEMFGAVGDGQANDTQAVQDCINYCVSRSSNNSKPVRGYGRYKVSSSVVIHGYNPDVYINQIDYTGDDAAVIVHSVFGRFLFGKVFASAGGTGAVGIRCSRASVTELSCDGYENNYLECAFLYANGNALEFITEPGGTTENLYYNIFRLPVIYSVNGHCIYTNTGLNAETDFYGKHCSAPNGYLYYDSTSSYRQPTHPRIRLHQFGLEGELKNGIRGNASLIQCRTRELMDRMDQSHLDRGILYDFTDAVPYALKDEYGGDVVLTSIKVDGALTFNDLVTRAKQYMDDGGSDYGGWSILGIEGRGYSLLKNVTLSATSGLSGSQRSLPPGDLYVYYNHLAYKPYDDWYMQINNDFTVALTSSNSYNYQTPTVFDINAASVDIRLDYSYCCLAINKFKVIQYTGKTAKVYDKLGNLIFDGTSLGEGTYSFTCSKVPLSEFSITLEDGTVKTAPAMYIRRIYTGENEKWTIEKQTTIEASQS